MQPFLPNVSKALKPELTDLELQLASSDGETLKQTLTNRLRDLHTQLQQQLVTGLPRSDYPIAATLVTAIKAAEEVLATWPTDANRLR